MFSVHPPVYFNSAMPAIIGDFDWASFLAHTYNLPLLPAVIPIPTEDDGPIDLSISSTSTRRQHKLGEAVTPQSNNGEATPFLEAWWPTKEAEQRWKCRFCDSTWASKNGQNRHERQFHEAEMKKLAAESGGATGVVLCEQCQKPFVSRIALLSHQSRSNICQPRQPQGKNNRPTSANKKTAPCDEKQDKPRHPCPYCRCHCTAMTSLRIHIRHYHADKVKALQNSDTTSDGNSLVAYEGSAQSACPYCNHRFFNSQGLSVHMTKSIGCRALRDKKLIEAC